MGHDLRVHRGGQGLRAFPQATGFRVQGDVDRRSAPAQGRLEGRERELVRAHGPGQGESRQTPNRLGAPEQQARLGAAEQLVPTRDHRVRPGLQGLSETGLVRQCGVRAQQTAAHVHDERHAVLVREGPQLRSGTEEVNPSTRKLLGWTLRMQPVSGPRAAS